MAATASGSRKPDEAEATSGQAPALQYSLLLDYLVGEKRGPSQAQAFDPAALGGFPTLAKSPEQKMVERAMESCGFKAALACVGGRWGGGRGKVVGARREGTEDRSSFLWHLHEA